MNTSGKRWVILIGLLLLTLWLVWSMPAAQQSEVVSVTTVKRQNQAVEQAVKETFSLTERQVVQDEVDSFDLFAIEANKPIIKPVKPRVKPRIQVKTKQPTFPFKYIGKLKEKNKTKVFLMERQALHIVHEGDRLGEFQLQKVSEQQLDWLYLPLNTVQVMNIASSNNLR